MTKSGFDQPRRIYPAWVKQPYSANAHQLAETMGRIASRCEHEARERIEMRRALEWCRANGNPHNREQAA